MGSHGPHGGGGTTVGMANVPLPNLNFFGVSWISVGERALRLAVLWGSGSGSVSGSSSSSIFSSDIRGLVSSSSCRASNLFRVGMGWSSLVTVRRVVLLVLVVQGRFGSVASVAMLSSKSSALVGLILLLVLSSCLRAVALAWLRSWWTR